MTKYAKLSNPAPKPTHDRATARRLEVLAIFAERSAHIHVPSGYRRKIGGRQ